MLKGVYTSDIQYTVTSLPKAIGFKLAQGKDWFSEYGWLQIPNVELDHTAQAIAKKTNLKKSTIKQDKAVKFDNNQDIPSEQKDPQEDRSKLAQQEFEVEKKRAKKIQENAKDELEVAQRAFAERTV